MKRTMLMFCLALAAPLSMLAQSTEVVVFEAIVSPSNEVPPRPASQQAAGTSTIVMNIKRDASGEATSAFIDFVMNAFYGAEETSRAMHIHRGGANVSGPVVLDSAFGDPVTTDPGHHTFVRRAEFVSSADLDVIEEVIADPSDFYINIHTASAPGGILRGQLIPAAGAEAQINALQELLRRVALRVGLQP